jgi:Cu/Ag efflux protein CusF
MVGIPVIAVASQNLGETNMTRSNKLWLGLLSGLVIVSMQTRASADETKGTIKSVDIKRHEVVMKGLVKDSLYELKKDAWIAIDGVKAKLEDFKEGDRAVVSYVTSGERMIASEVRGLRNAQEAKGTVKGTFAEKRELTLKGVVKDSTYELNKDATIVINGKASQLTDLREGDEVMVTYVERGDRMMANEVRASRK